MNSLLEEMELRSLERTSVKALIDASDREDLQVFLKTVKMPPPQLSQSCKDFPPAPVKPKKRRYLQPCLKTNYSQVIRKSDVVGKNLTIEALPRCVEHIAKQTLGGNISAVKCRCLFLGGGGFKIANSDTPCESRVCINRSKTKFAWSPNDSEAISPSPGPSRQTPSLCPKPHILPLSRSRPFGDLCTTGPRLQRPLLLSRKDDSMDSSHQTYSRLPKLFP